MRLGSSIIVTHNLWMSLKGRFAYFDKSNHSLCLGDGYYPRPKDNEVLIRVLTCGICRTGDLLDYIVIIRSPCDRW